MGYYMRGGKQVMKIIAVVDDSYGMMFNHRRISMDRRVREEIQKLIKCHELWMNTYSAEQFDLQTINIQVHDNFMEYVKQDDFAFIENIQVRPYFEQINSVILFYWNRSYPSDFKLDLIPSENQMKCTNRQDFVGNSHEKITMEVWEKK